jgi:RNA-directed DNA polymerase
MKPGNAGGGKDPDLWRAFENGEVKVIGCKHRPGFRSLQRKLHRKAKAEPAYRFYLLYDEVCREDILHHAYALARANAGALGVDGVTFVDIDLSGRKAWLAGLREELVSKTCRPNPVRRVSIPKPNGGERPLGIPTIRDRVGLDRYQACAGTYLRD